MPGDSPTSEPLPTAEPKPLPADLTAHSLSRLITKKIFFHCQALQGSYFIFLVTRFPRGENVFLGEETSENMEEQARKDFTTKVRRTGQDHGR